MKTILILYLFYKKIMLNFFSSLNIGSLKIKVLHPSINIPTVSSQKLLYGEIKNLKILDMGTGTGILALISKKKKAKYILGIDINKKCITNAYFNLKKNFDDDKNIEFKVSNLFENVDGKFDIIVSHPPYFEGEPRSMFDYSSFGVNIVEKILRNAKSYLNKNGEVRLLFLKNQEEKMKNLARKYKYSFNKKEHRYNMDFYSLIYGIMFNVFFYPKLEIFVFKP